MPPTSSAPPAGAAPCSTLRLRDGRTLAYALCGAPLEGAACTLLYFHGTPSCLLEAAVMEDAARTLGIAIVAADRAGIGLSSRLRWRSLQASADDARELTEHLGLRSTVVAGCSGGGPFAAAYAARYPEATEALLLVSAVAPTTWRHLRLLGAMRGADFLQLSLARLPPLGALWALHGLMAWMAQRHADTLLKYAPKGMAPADARALRDDPQVRAGFERCLLHAYCRGAAGMAQDVRLLGGRWGVDFARISCRVAIWQGEDDRSVPVAHARWWAATLPGAELTVLPGEGHVTVLLHHARSILEGALKLRSLGAAAVGGNGSDGGS